MDALPLDMAYSLGLRKPKDSCTRTLSCDSLSPVLRVEEGIASFEGSGSQQESVSFVSSLVLVHDCQSAVVQTGYHGAAFLHSRT